MNEELANLTLGYLIGYYKTHEQTIINKDEIDAINFIIEENEQLKEKLDCDLKWAFKCDKLTKENQQLKESYCNRTDCSGRLHDSRKYPSVKQQLDLYKSVLDEIREYIENNNLINILNRNDLLQILDKVGKE